MPPISVWLQLLKSPIKTESDFTFLHCACRSIEEGGASCFPFLFFTRVGREGFSYFGGGRQGADRRTLQDEQLVPVSVVQSKSEPIRR